MAEFSEALAQIARLLGDDRLRQASREEVRASMASRFGRLVEGLIDEAMASDDVIDRESALAFLDDRLSFLGSLLSDDERSRLREALQEKIESW